MPTRADLGRWLRHWLELGLPLPGQGDHLVSEALYLSDPDENGIEIYRDRPRDEWTWADGKVRMGTGPVDIRGLLTDAEQAGEPWAGLPEGTHLGHIHLQVSDIARSEAFYHDLLGFDIVAQMPTALFISAGGYHHHIGMNTWHSRGATPAPADMVGLRFFTVDLPDAEALAAVVGRLEAAGIPLTRQDWRGRPARSRRYRHTPARRVDAGRVGGRHDHGIAPRSIKRRGQTAIDGDGRQCFVPGLRSFYRTLRLDSGWRAILRLDGVGATGGDGRTDNRKPHPPATHPEPMAAPLRHSSPLLRIHRPGRKTQDTTFLKRIA